jgi:hypothetical protein
MAHFDITGDEVSAARRMALAARPVEAAQAQAVRHTMRVRRRVVAAEARYPLVHRRLLRGTPKAHVAAMYEVEAGHRVRAGRAAGRMTRGRACQLLEQLREYARLVGRDPRLVIDDIEALASGAGDDEDAADD